MIQRSSRTRLVAVTLIVAVQLLFVPATAGAASASLSGQILRADTRAPLAGAVVHLADPISGELFSSEHTDNKGSFRIASLPPSTYKLAVEAEGGLFTSETPVPLESGQSRSVQVALNQQAAPSPEEAEKKKKKKQGTSLWDNPLTATLVVLGAAIVAGVIIEEVIEDDDASPSNP